MIRNKKLFSDLDEGFLADICNANSRRSEIRGRGTEDGMFCEGQYGLFLSNGTEECFLGAILREESGVNQAIAGQGDNDSVQ